MWIFELRFELPQCKCPMLCTAEHAHCKLKPFHRIFSSRPCLTLGQSCLKLGNRQKATWWGSLLRAKLITTGRGSWRRMCRSGSQACFGCWFDSFGGFLASCCLDHSDTPSVEPDNVSGLRTLNFTCPILRRGFASTIS